jgi:hypothetical protein
MQRIDLKDILQRTVSDANGDLVTRRTGQVVRRAIEQMLAHGEGEVAGLDFGTVRCLDLSCADEIVGRLLRDRADARVVLLNVTAAHRDAIEFVLERHRLAVLVQDAALDLVGAVPDAARNVFGVLAAGGSPATEDVAQRLGLSPEVVQAALEELRQRDLVRGGAGTYQPPAPYRDASGQAIT